MTAPISDSERTLITDSIEVLGDSRATIVIAEGRRDPLVEAIAQQHIPCIIKELESTLNQSDVVAFPFFAFPPFSSDYDAGAQATWKRNIQRVVRKLEAIHDRVVNSINNLKHILGKLESTEQHFRMVQAVLVLENLPMEMSGGKHEKGAKKQYPPKHQKLSTVQAIDISIDHTYKENQKDQLMEIENLKKEMKRLLSKNSEAIGIFNLKKWFEKKANKIEFNGYTVNFFSITMALWEFAKTHDRWEEDCLNMLITSIQMNHMNEETLPKLIEFLENLTAYIDDPNKFCIPEHYQLLKCTHEAYVKGKQRFHVRKELSEEYLSKINKLLADHPS